MSKLSLYTHDCTGWQVKIIWGLGGAQSWVPLKGVGCFSSALSGLTGQLFGKGSKACGASSSVTNHSRSEALKKH